ncbi:MAG: hypothetical protein Rubg2KO_33210 [Rubricoccaceae bacterium]
MRSLSFVLSALLLLCLWPTRAEAQFGRLVNRAQRAAERTVNQAVDRTAEQATESAVSNAIPGRSDAVEAARQLVMARAGADGVFNPPGHGFDFSYISAWPGEAETLFAQVEAVEARYAEWQEPMRELGERFGPEWVDVQRGLLDLGVQAHEYGNGTDAASAFRYFAEGIEKVNQFRADAAERSLSEADMMFRLLGERFQMAEIRVGEAQKVKAQLEVGHRFDPQNAQVNARLATIDAEIDAVREDVDAEIDAGEWPTGDASAPQQFARAALEYFRSHPEWGGKEDVEVLAVVVRHDWQIAETNVLGQVTQWRLPIAVAATKPIWQESDAARVYELSLLANPGLPAAQAPPFWGYWVGDSHLARLNKIPTQ